MRQVFEENLGGVWWHHSQWCIGKYIFECTHLMLLTQIVFKTI